MKTRFRWATVLALLFVLGAGFPGQASASSCTAAYDKCLNDSWDTSGIRRIMADIDCFAEYIGCVKAKII